MYSYVEVSDILRIKKIYTAFTKRYDSSYYFEGEYHNFWEIVIVTDGEIGVTAGSDVLLLKKGQAILHEPMEFHRLWSEGNTCPEIIIFSFSADNLPTYSSKIFEIFDVGLPKTILQEITSAFEMNVITAKSIKDPEGAEYQLAVKKLEMFIIDTISQKFDKSNILQSRTARNYAAIVTVMENNIDKKLAIADIAKMCNMSEINLKKTFSRYAGMGVMQYFNDMKIRTAISMIKNDMTMQEIAAALGFSNQNYFSTVFKRITGNPPSDYR